MVTLWPLVITGIIPTGKISPAFVKNMARNRQVLILSWSIVICRTRRHRSDVDFMVNKQPLLKPRCQTRVEQQPSIHCISRICRLTTSIPAITRSCCLLFTPPIPVGYRPPTIRFLPSLRPRHCPNLSAHRYMSRQSSRLVTPPPTHHLAASTVALEWHLRRVPPSAANSYFGPLIVRIKQHPPCH